MLAHRLLVTEVMMMLDQAIEQRLIATAPHLCELNGIQFFQGHFDRCLVQQHRLRARTMGQRVVPLVGHRRQFDLSAAVQHQ